MTLAGQPLWYRFGRFESGDFAIIQVMQTAGICDIFAEKKNVSGRSATTVSAGVADRTSNSLIESACRSGGEELL